VEHSLLVVDSVCLVSLCPRYILQQTIYFACIYIVRQCRSQYDTVTHTHTYIDEIKCNHQRLSGRDVSLITQNYDAQRIVLRSDVKQSDWE